MSIPLSNSSYQDAMNSLNSQILSNPNTVIQKPSVLADLDNSKALENDLNADQKAILEEFLRGFKGEFSDYTAYLSAENDKQRKWLKEMADYSFQRELDAQRTSYQREFDSMREAGLNPYAYFLNGGSSSFTTPSHNVQSSSFATASRPQGLDAALQLFLKQLETYSNTAYRENMTEIDKEKLELQKIQLLATFASSLASAWNNQSKY